ncbi:MAG TPA: O-methyltransferase [Spirochaetia bacterium]|nr:O-methyltransferase [Spirochaetia bacterium]
MELIEKRVDEHLAELARHDDPLLNRLEARAAQTGFPIIGPVAGRFCYQVARMIGARRVFELGSGFGYSTLWFARAVQENGGGKVYHTVWDEGLSSEARSFIAEAGYESIVTFTVAEAVETLKQTEGQFDLIFNDIDKDGYPDSIPLIKDKLSVGGALIIDNMLWNGRIFDPRDRSGDTEGIRRATRLLFDDPDFVSSLIPLRDGVILALRVT